MPTEIAIVVAAIVLAFTLFAAVLASVDWYSNNGRPDGRPAE